MASERLFRFNIVGGECDGETVLLPAFWDGVGHRPPEQCRMQPKLPLPEFPVLDEVPTTEKVTALTYYRHIWQNGHNRWYDFRPEPPPNPRKPEAERPA